MRDRCIKHEILTPASPPPSGAGQVWARRCRYFLLQEWCRRVGIIHLLLAHHAQDQEETLLIRYRSGSGRLGLSGMPPVSTYPYVRVLRPFLGIHPKSFRTFLKSEAQSWIEDPSNRSLYYARGRLRVGNAKHQCLKTSTMPEKPFIQQFSSRDRFALEEQVDDLLARAVLISEFGFARINTSFLRRASLDVSVYCVRRVLACVGGLEYLPSEKKSRNILECVLSCSHRRGYNVGRCLVRLYDKEVLVVREERGILSRGYRFPSGLFSLGWTVFGDTRAIKDGSSGYFRSR